MKISDEILSNMVCQFKGDPGVMIAMAHELIVARKVVEAAKSVKDYRYDPSIGVKINLLEEAVIAYDEASDA